jgi:hypothetical protein
MVAGVGKLRVISFVKHYKYEQYWQEVEIYT